MKKLLLFIVFVAFASCSSDDNDCKKVTFLEAKESSNGSFIYTITIDNGKPTTTNKATVDFYRHSGAPDCFEGYKE